MAALGLLVTWQVVTRSFAAYLARETPEAALGLRSNEPDALVSLADDKLNRRAHEEGSAGSAQPAFPDDDKTPQQPGDRLGGWAEIALKAVSQRLDQRQASAASVAAAIGPALTALDREQIRARAELALVNDPLNARALRILGQLADAGGDEAKASQFMRAAAARSLRESAAVYAVLHQSFLDKDYAKTIYYADALLRKRPQLAPHAVPILARMAESPDPIAVGAVEKALMEDPPWRPAFFGNLMPAITDARTPLKLLLSLKDSPAPPTTADLSTYLNFLIGRKLYELAYYTWLQFLPPAALNNVGLLDNGGFETIPSGLPFDWVISPGSGVTIDIVMRPEKSGDQALFLEFGPGRADFRGVTQLLMLPSGNYRFVGNLKGEISGRRGLQWHLTCVGATVPIADGPMFIGVAPQWTAFEFAFTVPEAACRAQELRLDLAARSASEQLVSGSIWYDDLRISRAEPRPGSETVPAPPE